MVKESPAILFTAKKNIRAKRITAIILVNLSDIVFLKEGILSHLERIRE